MNAGPYLNLFKTFSGGDRKLVPAKFASYPIARSNSVGCTINSWMVSQRCKSIGHPTELDRAMGYEANFAGTSFLSPPEKVLNTFRYGPPLMNIVGNRTEVGGCSTCGWDDEGVPAQSWLIVDKGIFVNYQTTR